MRSLIIAMTAVLAGCGSEPLHPLIGAARSGDTKAIAAILAKGADPNQRWGVNGWTPLMHAIHKHRKASVEALIAGGADVNTRSAKGMTALIMAAGYGDRDMVQLLLEKGADAYLETADGDNALAAAVGGVPDIDKFTVGKCQTATVEALLTRAPDLKLKNNFHGRAARMAARVAGCTDVLSLLEGKRPATSERRSRGRV